MRSMACLKRIPRTGWVLIALFTLLVAWMHGYFMGQRAHVTMMHKESATNNLIGHDKGLVKQAVSRALGSLELQHRLADAISSAMHNSSLGSRAASANHAESQKEHATPAASTTDAESQKEHAVPATSTTDAESQKEHAAPAAFTTDAESQKEHTATPPPRGPASHWQVAADSADDDDDGHQVVEYFAEHGSMPPYEVAPVEMGSRVSRDIGATENANCPHARLPKKAAPATDRVILTSYFTTKKDPQRFSRTTGRPRFHASDNFQYIEKWYNSVVANNLWAVVLHDSLSLNFTQAYETENIKFVQVSLQTGLSGVDERWLTYLHFLRNRRYRYVLMTDVSDVVFEKDPFEFMSKTESRYDLWVGSEKMAGSLASSRWMIAKYKRCYGALLDKGIVYNCGVVGGKYDAMMVLLEHVECELRSMARHQAIREEMCDMVIFTHVYNTYLTTGSPHVARVFTGDPFHSEYKQKEPPGTGKYYIIHKK